MHIQSSIQRDCQKGKIVYRMVFGFKLHLVINDLGEIMAFKLTPATTDDLIPVDTRLQRLTGKLFEDRGYIVPFDKLCQRGL